MQMTGKKKLSTYSVHKLFQKLEDKHLIHTGVIVLPEVFQRESYNRLYEFQNYLDGKYWTEFKKYNKCSFKFLNNLEDIDTTQVVCVWFFRERPDTAEYRKYCRDKKIDPYKDFVDLTVNKHNVSYQTNTMLITNKDIKLNKNKFVIRRPCVQIDLQTIDIVYKKKIKKMLLRNLG